VDKKNRRDPVRAAAVCPKAVRKTEACKRSARKKAAAA